MNLSRIRNRFSVLPIVVNSLPKAGTNLLTHTLSLFPGVSDSGLHLGSTTAHRYGSNRRNLRRVPVGIDFPSLVSVESLRRTLKSLTSGSFANGHLPYSNELALLFAELNMRTILILRDPRDVAVSHAKYVANTKGHPLFDYYQGLSEHDRLMASITGISVPDGPTLLNLRHRLVSLKSWEDEPFNYTTYFERLVGDRGGGSTESQVGELRCLADHLDIRCSNPEIERIASRAFGGTSTFRKGKIGGWRDEFHQEHKEVCKQMIGDLLVDMNYEWDNEW